MIKKGKNYRIIVIASGVIILLAVAYLCCLKYGIPERLINGEEFLKVPFTEYYDGEMRYDAEVCANRLQFRLREKESGETIILPKGYVPLKIVNVGEACYVFARIIHGKTIVLFKEFEERLKPVDLPAQFDEFIFRDAVYYHNHLESAILFVAYNVESCKNALFKLNVLDGNVSYADGFTTDLTFGDNEIDENVKMVVSNDTDRFYGMGGVYILGTLYYYTYSTWSPVAINRYEYDDACRLTEVYWNAEQAYCLVSQEETGRWRLMDLNNARRLIILDELPQGSWSATIGFTKEGEPEIEPVYREDLISLFRRDVTNLQCGGMIECGTNNLEGRIPWAQVYYLNGWIDMVSDWYGRDIELDGYEELTRDLRERLRIEQRCLDEQLRYDDGMTCKRYSLLRAPTIGALHAARILLTENRYRYYVDEAYEPAKNLAAQAYQFDGTVEQLAVAAEQNENGLSAGTYYMTATNKLLINDVPTPYNYHSAYAEAAFSQVVLGRSVDDQTIRIAKDFVSILLNSEEFQDGDPDLVWPYFFGEPYEGWEYNEARNVRCFPGQTYTADISYRSMDAMAIIYAMRALPELYDKDTISYLKNGIASGKLYPFVNSALADSDYDIAQLDGAVASTWLRVRHSWNIQNAAWAYYYALHTDLS